MVDHTGEANGAAGDSPALAPHVPELHLAGLLAQVRSEVARRDSGINVALPPPPLAGAWPTLDWEREGASINETLALADAGSKVPELKRFTRLARFFARPAAAIALWFGRVFTGPQRRFNHRAVHLLHELSSLLHTLDEAGRATRGSLQECILQHHHLHYEQRQDSQRQQISLRALQERLALLDTLVRSQQTAFRGHQGILQEHQGAFRELRRTLRDQATRIAELEKQLVEAQASLRLRETNASRTIPC